MNRLGRYFAIFIQQMDLDPAQRVTIEAIETEVENQRYHEKQSLKWFTEFGHLNRGDMLTSEQHRCHNEKKKFQRRV